MSTYAIGDVQGCFKTLKSLLTEIQLKPATDTLWFVGDLVNRGPDSLSVLRFLQDLPQTPVIVLGNHDLHLLAVYSGHGQLSNQDTLEAVLEAPDSALLCDWLRQKPLLHQDETLGYTLVHAGLPPQWGSKQAKQYAQAVEQQLKSDHYADFFAQLYGETPHKWDEGLTGWERLRFIVNALTRLRFCTLDGSLDFAHKGVVGSQPRELYPWFDVPKRASMNDKILFGHWSALNRSMVHSPNVFALDTGCVWGRELTAFRLEDQRYFSVRS